MSERALTSYSETYIVRGTKAPLLEILCSGNVAKSLINIPYGNTDELIRFQWSGVKVYGHCHLTSLPILVNTVSLKH